MCCACRSLVRIRKAEGGGAVADRLDELYRPQIEQFGITLEEAGDALTGAVSDERARARVVVYRLKGLCVVTSHRIEVRSDMAFHERSVPGLCVCTLSADSPRFARWPSPTERSALATWPYSDMPMTPSGAYFARGMCTMRSRLRSCPSGSRVSRRANSAPL